MESIYFIYTFISSNPCSAPIVACLNSSALSSLRRLYSIRLQHVVWRRTTFSPICKPLLPYRDTMHPIAKFVSVGGRRVASSKLPSWIPVPTSPSYSPIQNESTLPLGGSRFATDNTLSSTRSTTLNKLGHTLLFNQPLQASITNQTRRLFFHGRKSTVIILLSL